VEDFVTVPNGQNRVKAKWLGGYVRHGKKGPTYVIERWFNGERFHLSTKCRTERAALKALEAFESNPAGWRPTRQAAERLKLTDELLTEYRDWMISMKKTSKDWACTCNRMLIEWLEDLNGRDIRHVTIHGDLEPALDRRGTSRKHRIEALKAFCKWLRRRKGLLTAGQDPTVDLPVPPSQEAEQSRAIPEKRISAVLAYLPEDARDVLLVLMGSGAHISEVRRFATEGSFERVSKTQAIMRMMHKRRRNKLFPLKGRVYVEAAARVKERGAIPANWTLNEDVTKACELAGVERFTFGVIRHSFATNAFKKGHTLGQVGDALHHSNTKTTRGHYVVEVPPTPVTPLRVLSGGKA
jgi:integrase